MDFFNNVKPGARVHYMTPQGQTRSGTVVMNRGTHLVLNRGGGQPQVVTKDNYIKHSEGGKVKGALLSRVAKSMKEDTLNELETSTLKSYGRKALKDLPKQVKRARTSWDKHVATNMNPDPNKAWDVMIDAEHKQKVRKAGIKRLATQLKARGETSVNEASLEAQKTALAYDETKKKIKKKKHPKGTKSAVKEGYDARETEHSGAKKGKGAYYGRKKDAKKESNKARREADKKSCCAEDTKPMQKLAKFAQDLHDDPVRIRRVKAIARLKAIKKVHKAEQDEKSKHGGWTGMKEERIDEIGPFNISKHPAGAKALKVVDKVLNKIQDRADARYQKKQDKIAKDRYGKSWTEAGMKAPRKIDPMHQRYPDGSGPEKNESFTGRLNEVSRELLTRYVRRAARSAAAAGEQGGVAWGREAMRTKDLDAAEKAERKHINKARKRIKGIDKAVSKIGQDSLNANVFASEETQLDEISKEKLRRYINFSSLDIKHQAKASEWKSDPKDREKAEEKADKRREGIRKAAEKLTYGARVPATGLKTEGRESEYRANMQLAGTARKKPGHYLVRNGQHISGPHDPQGALNKYKGMSDNTGVKIVHIKEAANSDKAKQATQKAIFAAKAKKKGKTAHVEPELETPSASTSQPLLQGPEGADNANI